MSKCKPKRQMTNLDAGPFKSIKRFSELKLMPCKDGSVNCDRSLDNYTHELTLPVPKAEKCCASLGWQ